MALNNYSYFYTNMLKLIGRLKNRALLTRQYGGSGIDIERLQNRDRRHLAKAITLLESSLPEHQEQSIELMEALLENAKKNAKRKSETFRIGITGPPGAGKSTFIEALGVHLLDTNPGANLVVLTIDPSSHISGGSILGDKTRMERLSLHPRALIRSTPTKGQLGGLAFATAEVVRLCELVGYDYAIIETVGVGQSELDVHEIADITTMLVAPGNGDSLQGMKKGLVELAHLVVVNKADGSIICRALEGLEERKSKYEFVKSDSSTIPGILIIS